MPTFKDVEAAIAEMNALYPRPAMPPISLSSPYDVSTEFSKPYPNAGNGGVYVLFSADEEVLYVGKASVGLGSRLGAHFRRDTNNRDRGTSARLEFSEVAILRTISLPKGREFEAPAIEEFLIKKLIPPLNKNIKLG